MSKITFEPWVGENYWDCSGRFDKRILLLGESHYAKNRDPRLTQNVIEDHMYNFRRATYTKIERALVGYETDYDDTQEIWNSIAFYNYVQEPLSGPRVAPTNYQFSSSEDAFRKVINKLEPDLVLVWGRRLWKAMKHGALKEKGSYGRDCWWYGYGEYPLNSGNAASLYSIQHPASNFSWDWWNELLCDKGIL